MSASRIDPIIQKAADIVHKVMSNDEFIKLGEALDGDNGDQFLEAVNEHLMEDSPEVFGIAGEVGVKEEKRAMHGEDL